MTRWLFILALLAGCSEECGPVDRGLMVIDGNELQPATLPFEVVVSDNMDHPDAVIEAAEDVNSWLSPVVVAFDPVIDQDRFDSLDGAGDSLRYGTIIVSEGHVGTPPDWHDELHGDDIGGVATLAWDDEGQIMFADIVLNFDHAYNRPWVHRNSLHELGHTLGLAHDDSSLDLGSCMASPPEYDCHFTEYDITLLTGN